MTVQFPAPNLLDEEIRLVLQGLAARAAGQDRTERLERQRVDLKEEAGRRDAAGVLQPGGTRNEVAAKALAAEAACMANTPGAGALIVGVADDGTLVGTNLATEWLRHRLYQLTDRRLTADAQEVAIAGVRLVVLRMSEAIEPVRYGGRIRWRVDDHCVEIDATTWHARNLTRIGFDWSAQASPHPMADARATALQIARDYLRASNETKALDLAGTTDEDLLRRLNVVTPDGYLTNAGALAFVGRPTAAIDYLRRAVSGGNSQIRVNQHGRGLLEELQEAERAIAVYNPTEHIESGIVIGQRPQLPPEAVREAIVNGLAHRDWGTDQATVVEHTGTTLVVSSPGGFIEGINAGNIITHPSRSRNTQLTALLAALRVAEREGIGVDRMVRDMIRVGLEPPVIEQVDGPIVRTALIGGSADRGWLDFLHAITPTGIGEDLDVLLILRDLAEHGWVDATNVAPVIQRSTQEATAAIARLAEARLPNRTSTRLAALATDEARRRNLEQLRHASGDQIITPVDGTPSGAAPAWCWTRSALERLAHRTTALTSVAGRRHVAARYGQHRGRISTTELASIAHVSTQHAGRTLKELEELGVLAAGRPERVGRGFFYVPTTPTTR